MLKYISIIFVCVLGGCARSEVNADTIAKAGLYDALYAFQCGDRKLALDEMIKTRNFANANMVKRSVAVEIFDDSGLYYFVNDDIENARICQSIAVLLSLDDSIPDRMKKFYLGNLGKIYSKLEMQDEFSKISSNERLLLDEPTISKDVYVQKYVVVP